MCGMQSGPNVLPHDAGASWILLRACAWRLVARNMLENCSTPSPAHLLFEIQCYCQIDKALLVVQGLKYKQTTAVLDGTKLCTSFCTGAVMWGQEVSQGHASVFSHWHKLSHVVGGLSRLHKPDQPVIPAKNRKHIEPEWNRSPMGHLRLSNTLCTCIDFMHQFASPACRKRQS
ncbi:hypothetical protein BJY52DRAFT_1281620 [Lactarius psammicola]|nr:hypothetical protein BJY52DRAFT_1281620 [Lactarius psammicola]